MSGTTHNEKQTAISLEIKCPQPGENVESASKDLKVNVSKVHPLKEIDSTTGLECSPITPQSMDTGCLSVTTKDASTSLVLEMSDRVRKVSIEVSLCEDPETPVDPKNDEKQPTSDWKTLAKLLTCVVLVFLPTYTTAARISVFASDHHDSLSSTLVGGLISATYLGALVSSPIVGIIAPRIGRKRACLIGMAFLSASMAVLAAASYVTSSLGFCTLVALSGLFLGISEALTTQCVNALIQIEFPTKAAQYSGLFSLAIGIGCLLGPVITVSFAFDGCFFILAAISLIIGLVAVITLPDRLNETHTDSDAGKEGRKLSWQTVLCNRIGLTMFLTLFVMFIVQFSYVATLSPRLIKRYGVERNYTGLFFSLNTLVFAVGGLLVGGLTAKVDKYKVAAVGLALYPGGMLFMGSSSLLTWAFEDSVSLIIVGLVVLGFAEVAVLTPSTNIMVEGALETLKKDQLETQDSKTSQAKIKARVSDIAAAMWNTAYCSGCIFGPVIGGALSKRSYTFSMEIMSALSLILMIVFVSIMFCGFCKKNGN